MSFSPALMGCDFELTQPLATPIVELHPDSKCITWNAIENAKQYDIFINGKKADSVSASDSVNSRLFDFSPYLSSVGEYTFNVVARRSKRLTTDSDESESVTYIHQLEYGDSSVPIPKDTSIVESEQTIVTSIVGTRLNFQRLSMNVDGYKLYLYSASTGLQSYTISNDTSYINLLADTYSLRDEIYAVRMGFVDDGQEYISSDIKYLNPDNYVGYTDRIYTFDGYINDYYIEDLVELRNIIYYSFVYRLSSLDVKLSNRFEDNIISTYIGNNNTQRVISAVIDAFEYIFETRNQYSISCRNTSFTNKTYTININYNSFLNNDNLPACEYDNTYIPPEGFYLNELDWMPSYQLSSLTMRNEDSQYAESPYDDFVSDKQFIYTEVSSSEELYWAVENKVTPIVQAGSMAERIYEKAKNVLRNIISDRMTDYEKALAIFDWISANTEYDHYSCNSGETYDTESATNIPAYYLEGVFITGYAVCDGYSKAFSLLCNMEGIDCIRVVGVAVSGGEAGGHAWNKVLIDKYPDDGIDAKYYLVDITWSAMTVYSSWNEVSSHRYFLISDNDVLSTHYTYSLREKFFYYNADSRFDFYNYQTFNFQGKQYNLVIDSDSDAEAVFEYMLYSHVDTMEVVVDFNYMKSVYNSSPSARPYANFSAIIEATLNKFRNLKFAQQSFVLYTNYNAWELVRYSSATVSGGVDSGKGVILVLEQSLYIDESNDVGHLVDALNHYLLCGEYDLRVTPEMLGVDESSVPEDMESAKAYYENLIYNLFASAIEKYCDNISISFSFECIEGEVVVSSDNVLVIDLEYLFKIHIEQK